MRTLLTSTPSAVTSRDAERGSQTTEYALLLVVAATIAMLLLNWAQSDGGISSLLDTVIDQVLGLLEVG